MSEIKFHPNLSSNDVLIDREQAFLLYCANTADVEKTAHALGISPIVLLKVVDEEGWCARLQPVLEKMKSQRPGDVERGINRALAFVQAHRFRLVLERALRMMTNWTDEEMEDYLLPQSFTKEGLPDHRKISTRWAADFATALEKCHSMAYAALNDTATERVRRKEETPESSALDLHARIAQAMSGAGSTKTPRGLLFDAQLAVAADVAKQATVPKPVVSDEYEPDQH